MLYLALHLLFPRDSPKLRTQLLIQSLLWPSWKPGVKQTLRTTRQHWFQAEGLFLEPSPQSSDLSHISCLPGGSHLFPKLPVCSIIYAFPNQISNLSSLLSQRQIDPLFAAKLHYTIGIWVPQTHIQNLNHVLLPLHQLSSYVPNTSHCPLGEARKCGVILSFLPVWSPFISSQPQNHLFNH